MNRDLFIVCVILIAQSACVPTYVPNVANVPMHQEQGDLELSLHAGTAGFDPQVALAITDQFGFMANGSFLNSTNDSNDGYHRHSFVEIGMGYYANPFEYLHFDVYAGYGFGRLEGFYENSLWDDFARVSSNRLFVQPCLGFSSRLVDLGFTTRIAYVMIEQNNIKSSGLFLEPVLTFKVGMDYFKAIWQMGFSVPQSDEALDFRYQPFLFSVGFQLSIGNIVQMTKKTETSPE